MPLQKGAWDNLQKHSRTNGPQWVLTSMPLHRAIWRPTTLRRCVRIPIDQGKSWNAFLLDDGACHPTLQGRPSFSPLLQATTYTGISWLSMEDGWPVRSSFYSTGSPHAGWEKICKRQLQQRLY